MFSRGFKWSHVVNLLSPVFREIVFFCNSPKMSDCTLMTDDEPAPKRPKVEKDVSGIRV